MGGARRRERRAELGTREGALHAPELSIREDVLQLALKPLRLFDGRLESADLLNKRPLLPTVIVGLALSVHLLAALGSPPLVAL
jgi:hypothetical protein